MAGTYNLSVANGSAIDQGADYTLTITAQQPAGVAINLTGYTVRGMVRLRYADVTPVATFTAALFDAVNGVYTLTLTAAVTTLLNPGEYVWDTEIVSGAAIVTRLLGGTCTVTPEVTK